MMLMVTKLVADRDMLLGGAVTLLLTYSKDMLLGGAVTLLLTYSNTSYYIHVL